MRRLGRGLAGLLLAGLASALPAVAAERDDAYAAYQTGHYRRALGEALKRIEADSKDAAAMTLVGELYRLGYGVPPDQKVAAEWYERASERGDINATYALAIALLDDASGRRDPDRAGALLRRAAEAGHPAANYNLALALLATGQVADDALAIKSLERAAEYGIGDAMYALGTLAKQGRGMPKSEEKAAEWLAKAVVTGNIAAEIEYAIMLFNGTGVAANERAAATLFLRAAHKGNPIAQNRIARLYQIGRGIAPDSIEAAAWHLVARTRGLDDPALDQLFDRLNPEQQGRAARLAASRIEGAALTAP